jgi:hypothetical protein
MDERDKATGTHRREEESIEEVGRRTIRKEPTRKT